MSSNNKTIIIRLRVDEATANAIREKADACFNGNVSACIRCATLQYESGSTKPTATNDVSASLVAILRHLKKIGTNVNQIARQINERMKESPFGLSSSDIQPFVIYRQDLSQIYELIQNLKERL